MKNIYNLQYPIRRALVFVFLFLSFFRTGFTFGKNKVRTTDFKWNIESTGYFDIYFYGRQGEQILPYVKSYLKTARSRAKEFLVNIPKDPLPFFIYNNHNDFEQTNIVSIGEGTGGVTEALKNRFMAGHTGSYKYLKYVIMHEYIHEVQFEYLYSGFWRSMRLTKSVIYPNWLLEGMAEFATKDVDGTVREMYLRDASLNKKLISVKQLNNFNHVLPHQVTLAYKESEAFIRYVIEEYGQNKLHDLIISYKDNFDANSVLMDVLGTDISAIDRKFREYLEDKHAFSGKELKKPDSFAKKLTESGAYPRFYEGAVYFPNQKKIAYISDERGSREIYIKELPEGNTKRIVGRDALLPIENISSRGRPLSISGDGRYLAFCGEKEQKDYIFIYDLENEDIRQIKADFESLYSPCFSHDGSKLYFSALKNASSDIYCFDFNTNNISQLTNTPFEDTDCYASRDGKYLAFASEHETLSENIEYDISLLDLENGTIEKYTSFAGDERYPVFSPDGKYIYFTSDVDGICDIYSLDFNKNLNKITRVIGGNFNIDISGDGEKILFSSFLNGEKNVYSALLKELAGESKTESILKIGTSESEYYRGNVSDIPGHSPAVRKKYSFKASTDLFFPFIFYSSLDGLFLAAYYQASDFLGNHQLGSVVSYASGSEYIDFDLSYGFLKYRTNFYLNFGSEEYYWDRYETIKRKDRYMSVTAAYPLNRFQRIELLAGTVDRKEIWHTEDVDYKWEKREDIAGLGFYHDTVQGPYLEVTSGRRFRIEGEFSNENFGANYIYENALLEFHSFFPIGKENVIAFRNFLAGSFDRDAGYFYLGGESRIRGLSRNLSFSGHRVFISNLEWRFPIVHNINYHMWYFFPDFFFKTFYGSVFVDGGFAWDEDIKLKNVKKEDWKGSYGISLRFHTFIIQSYPFLLNIQFARLMDSKDISSYITFGSVF